MSTAARDCSLPDGWEMHLDESRNRYFYVDHNTQTTHWEPPTTFASSSAKVIAASVPVKRASSVRPVIVATTSSMAPVCAQNVRVTSSRTTTTTVKPVRVEPAVVVVPKRDPKVVKVTARTDRVVSSSSSFTAPVRASVKASSPVVSCSVERKAPPIHSISVIPAASQEIVRVAERKTAASRVVYSDDANGEDNIYLAPQTHSYNRAKPAASRIVYIDEDLNQVVTGNHHGAQMGRNEPEPSRIIYSDDADDCDLDCDQGPRASSISGPVVSSGTALGGEPESLRAHSEGYVKTFDYSENDEIWLPAINVSDYCPPSEEEFSSDYHGGFERAEPLVATPLVASPIRPAAGSVNVLGVDGETWSSMPANNGAEAMSYGLGQEPRVARLRSSRAVPSGKVRASTATTPFPPYPPCVAPIVISYDDGQNASTGRYKNMMSVVGRKLEKYRKKGAKGIKNSLKAFTSDLGTSLGDVRAERVTLNEYPLTPEQIRWFSIHFKVRMRDDTNYWYDHRAGFLGKHGGRAKHFIDPNLPIKGEMHPRTSFGDSSVFLNGREIPASECIEFRMWGMPFRDGSRLTVDANGDIRPEGSRGPPLCNWRSLIKAKQSHFVAALATSKRPGARPQFQGGGRPRPNPFQPTNFARPNRMSQQQEFYERMQIGQPQDMYGYGEQFLAEQTANNEPGMTPDPFWGLEDPMENAWYDGDFIRDFYESDMGSFLTSACRVGVRAAMMI